jgi:hypothetical protein
MMRLVIAAVSLGLLVLTSSTSAQGVVLYGTTAGFPGAGSLFSINVNTGAATLIGPLKNTLGELYGVTGLAFQPGTGVLFGSTSNNSPTSPHAIVTINPANGLVTFVGTASPTDALSDITFTPDGRLWGWPESSVKKLVSVNTSTGTATALGPGLVTLGGSGLASDASGTLYFFGRGDGNPLPSPFHTLSTSTGAPTQVGTITGGSFLGGTIAAAKFSPSGVLYAVDNDFRGVRGTFLVTINPATGVMTKVGASVPFLDAIAFAPAASTSVPAVSTSALVLLGVLMAGMAIRRLTGQIAQKRPSP